ncbi:Uncharacterised protein [Klebsiella pneumoniae]|nr:Uncharacterised protein [Klebsiella pneumoniae]
MARFHFGQQPVTHKEQHHDGNQHRYAFQQFTAGAGVSKQHLEDSGGDDAGDQRHNYRLTNKRQLILMVVFHHVGHDCRNNQQRFQPLAHDDHQTIEQQTPLGFFAFAQHRHGFLQILRQRAGLCIQALNRLTGLHQTDQAGKIRLQRGFKCRIARADFVFHAAGFEAVEVGILDIQNRILRIAALIARYRVLNALVNSRRHLSPVGAVISLVRRRNVVCALRCGNLLIVTGGWQAG